MAYDADYHREWRAKNKARIAAISKRYNSTHEARAKANASRAKRYAENPGKKQAERKFAALNRRAKFNAWMARVKNAPCVDCGRTFPPCAMDFDHVRGDKIFDVSRGVDKTCAAVSAEIAKCDLVCACCHRIRTARRHDALLA